MFIGPCSFLITETFACNSDCADCEVLAKAEETDEHQAANTGCSI